MKKSYRALVRAGLLVAATSAIGVAVAAPASAHASDAYSHDSTIGVTNTDWMSWLPGGALLSELSMPGTHDTGAYRAGGDIVLTQSMTMQEQLKSGIRAWDIRLGKDTDGRLKVYHGISKQGQDFESEVLATATGFLAAHPGEAIVMRIKHETGPTDGFAALVKAGLDKHPSRVYNGTSNNPTLADIRGKIVVLRQFSSDTRIGIPYTDNPGLVVGDDYKVRSNWDLANKWWAVENRLNAAQNGPRDIIYATFLSGSEGSFPYFVASGHSNPGTGASNLLTGLTRGIIDTCRLEPRCIPEFPSVDCFLGTCSVAFEGTNILTMNEINQRGRPNRFGIVYADFPGKGLVEAVIGANEFGGVLRGWESGRCADVPGGTQQNSTQVQLWDCHAGANQTWTATPAGQLKVYGTKCLDVRSSGTTDGTPVQIYDCNGTGAQQWVYRADGSLVNPNSGKCLDAMGHGTTNGTPIAIWTCNGGANQMWFRR